MGDEKESKKKEWSVKDVRAYFGLSNLDKKKKEIRCLRCRKFFMSEGPENQMCCHGITLGLS